MDKICKTPSVYNCLNCAKPDCNCASDAAIHISEIKALVMAGVLKPQAISLHYNSKGFTRRK